MKVFQCIHKYSPHIPLFEKRHGITDQSDFSFKELQRLVIDDGYASAYILKPALEHKSEEVFFTIWDYERLQHLWAKENALQSTDLSEIKLAQIKAFKPDVFYNMSPNVDNSFIENLVIERFKCKFICWNSFIEKKPRTYPFYDVHLTLHKPFLNYWNKLNLKGFELQPSIPADWEFKNPNRPIDVLFYGQYNEWIFLKRNKLIERLIDYKNINKHKVRIHLQYKIRQKAWFKLYRFEKIKLTFPNKLVVENSLPPLYGDELYKTIGMSKIVINAYGDNNQFFKSNLRVFEAIGHGAFLISERGHYPEGLEPDVDFYIYDGFEELVEKVEIVLENWEKHKEIAQRTAEKVRKYFSKETQWTKFLEVVKKID